MTVAIDLDTQTLGLGLASEASATVLLCRFCGPALAAGAVSLVYLLADTRG